ncbi:LapA family protein [Synechococcus moorigangaii CMS01]|nr:LapA family protein [Synechococcus moorigangaii CMS01]
MEFRSAFGLIFLLLLGGSGLLLQNNQPLQLVLFSRAVPWQLPLSVWLMGAIVLGLILSVLLQLFLGGNKSNGKSDRPNPRLDRLKQRPPRQPDRRTGRSDWERSRANYDWTDKELESQDEETWDIESPPSQPTRPKPPSPTPEEPQIRPQPKPQRPRPQPEAAAPRPQTPKIPENNKEQVYDADYRILTPPYNPETDSNSVVDPDTDEEWI